MPSSADSLDGLAKRALVLNEPTEDPIKEVARLRAQSGVLRELAGRLADRVGRPGPAKVARQITLP